MIIAEVNKKIVQIPSDWAEITFSQAAECYKEDYPVVTDTFEWFEHLPFVKRMVLALTDINKETIDRIDPVHLVHVWTKYLSAFVYDLKAETPSTYHPQMINHFTHKGVTYLMPRNLDVIGGNVILQHDQSVKAFIEASNLLAQFSKVKKDGLSVLPMFVASIVKQDRLEEWDEVEIMRRAKEFETLPMSVIWEVFFCMSQLTIKLGSTILQSMRQELEAKMTIRRAIKMLASRRGLLLLQRAELRDQLKALMN